MNRLAPHADDEDPDAPDVPEPMGPDTKEPDDNKTLSSPISELETRLFKNRTVLVFGAINDKVARDVTGRLLALASDWAFMVTKDSAAGYARDRHARHHREARLLADLIERGDVAAADDLARRLRSVDGPFGHLDARLLTG